MIQTDGSEFIGSATGISNLIEDRDTTDVRLSSGRCRIQPYRQEEICSKFFRKLRSLLEIYLTIRESGVIDSDILPSLLIQNPLHPLYYVQSNIFLVHVTCTVSIIISAARSINHNDVVIDFPGIQEAEIDIVIIYLCYRLVDAIHSEINTCLTRTVIKIHIADMLCRTYHRMIFEVTCFHIIQVERDLPVNRGCHYLDIRSRGSGRDLETELSKGGIHLIQF